MDSDNYFQEHFNSQSNNDDQTHNLQQNTKDLFDIELGSSDAEVNYLNTESFLPSDVSDTEIAEAEQSRPSRDVKEDRDELIDEIFGEDDVDDFEGFNQNEEEKGGEKPKEDSSHELPEEMSDFDIMMKNLKKRKKVRKRRRTDEIALNDNDDYINVIVQDMTTASDADRNANKARRPGISKLQMLPYLVSQLQKKHLQHAFIDGGFLGSLAEWFSPLPDGSLPTLKIRNELLPILENFPIPDLEILKMSRIGKAIMYLYKSSKETKENRILCKKIMDSWSRPLFNLSTDYKSMDREERRYQDMLHARSKRRRVDESCQDRSSPKASTKTTDPYFARARVPTLSTKDYINRPISTVPSDHLNERKPKGNITMTQRLNRLRQIKEKKRSHGSESTLSITKI